MPGGQPTKFNKEVRRQIKILALKGFTDAEMASVVGVTETTINNWKIAHPKFFESLKDWKAQADYEVERSLYERATGFVVKKDINVDGEVITLENQLPPDPTSMIFWLKNRKKDEWADRQGVELTNLDTLADKLIAANKRAKDGSN